MHTFDVIIIGAGPAGLSTALHIVQQDPALRDRILVIEKAVHPRHKLCGGGIRSLWLSILADLDIPVPPPIPHQVVNEARFVFENHQFSVKSDPEFLVFHRPVFDHYLVQTARERGIQIREGEVVLSIKIETDAVQVTTDQAEYRTQILVGADGSKGITRRIAGNTGRKQPGFTARLLETISPTHEREEVFTEKYALFDFSQVNADLQGYTWIFPAKLNDTPHLNQGIYDARYAPTRPKASLMALLQKTFRRNSQDAPQPKIEGHPIHLFTPLNHFAKPRLLLVGDAVGADPLFGEGIGPALAFGKIAAATIQDALRRQNFAFKNYRWKVLRSYLGGYLLSRWYGAWWGYRFSGQKWFMIMMWSIGRLLTWQPQKQNQVSGTQHGKQT